VTAVLGPISALLAICIGLALTALLAPAELWPCSGLLRLMVVIPIGIGVCSATFFLSLIATVPHLAIESLLLAGLLLWRFRTRTNVASACGGAGPADGQTQNHETPFRFVFFLLAAANAAVFAFWSARWPRGGWDGWAIWNQRARFLHEAGGSWRDAFSPALAWSHTEYPLLMPVALARAWNDLGNETSLVPIFISGLFAVAVTGLLVLSLSALRGRAHAFAAAALLLATPSLVQTTASQYIDVTLSYFVLATLALQCFADRQTAPERWLVLSGITAGLAAWTKIEGLALLPAGALALAATANREALLRRVGAFLAGASPFLLTLLCFRWALVDPWYFLGQHGAPRVTGNLLNVHRYVVIAKAFVSQFWRFGSPLVSPAIFLAGYLLCSGVRIPRPRPAAAGLTLLLMAGGYFAIYILTPYDLDWQLATSLDRLCLQLWPGALFAIMLCAGDAGAIYQHDEG
jgi:hypothetical protein